MNLKEIRVVINYKQPFYNLMFYIKILCILIWNIYENQCKDGKIHGEIYYNKKKKREQNNISSYYKLGGDAMNWNFKKNVKLKGVQILALGFLLVILVGALILTLPISTTSGESTNFLDALFTATSAVCVTGLIVVDTGTYWNAFGQTVIMILIEIGGLGFMSFTTLIAIILGKKITLRERLILQDAMNTFNIQGLVKMVKICISVYSICAIFWRIIIFNTICS